MHSQVCRVCICAGQAMCVPRRGPGTCMLYGSVCSCVTRRGDHTGTLPVDSEPQAVLLHTVWIWVCQVVKGHSRPRLPVQSRPPSSQVSPSPVPTDTPQD